VAKALMGRRPGDVVEVATPRGVRRQRVVSLGG
jgi:transcription elongation GreA/GreB family factor